MRHNRDYDYERDEYKDKRDEHYHDDRRESRAPQTPPRRPIVQQVKPQKHGASRKALKFFVGVAIVLGLSGAGMGGYSLYKTYHSNIHNGKYYRETGHIDIRLGTKMDDEHPFMQGLDLENLPQNWEEWKKFIYKSDVKLSDEEKAAVRELIGQITKDLENKPQEYTKLDKD